MQAVHEACSQIGRIEGGVVHLENTSLMFTGIKPGVTVQQTNIDGSGA